MSILKSALPWKLTGSRIGSLATIGTLVLSLVACGGGGGGGENTPAPTNPPPPTTPPTTPPAPSPPPITPSITLTADAQSVFGGEAGVKITADIQNSNSTPTWMLDGVGTLSKSTGIDVQYLPPDLDSVDENTTTTITASLDGSVTQKLSIVVKTKDIPGRRWTVARQPSLMHGLSKVVYGGGNFIALAKYTLAGGSNIFQSTDGINWERRLNTSASINFTDIAWGTKGWVAVSGPGHTATSSDGLSWAVHMNALHSEQDSHASQRKITLQAGNNLYIANRQYIGGEWISSDGIKWNPINNGVGTVAFGNGIFIGSKFDPATRIYRNYVGTDGQNWTETPTLKSGIRSFTFRETDFLVAYEDSILSSTDGASWLSNPYPFYRSAGGHSQEITYQGRSLFCFQSDQSVWDDSAQVLLQGQSKPKTITLNELTTPNSVAASADKYIGVSWRGWVTTSTNGLDWTPSVEGTVGELSTVEYFNNSYVAISDSGWQVHSKDAKSWTSSKIYLSPFRSTYDDIVIPTSMAQGNGTLVAVGRMYRYPTNSLNNPASLWMRTLDGENWTYARTPAPSSILSGVVFDGKRFVAIDVNGALYSSNDGDVWSSIGALQNTPSNSYLVLSFGNGLYVATSSLGYIATSKDAVNWSQEKPISPDPNRYFDHAPIIWTGSVFVAAGSRVVATSLDGKTWSTADFPLSGRPTLTTANGRIIATGVEGIYSSSDGLRWRKRYASDEKGIAISSATFAAGRFVAIGKGNTVVTSER